MRSLLSICIILAMIFPGSASAQDGQVPYHVNVCGAVHNFLAIREGKKYYLKVDNQARKLLGTDLDDKAAGIAYKKALQEAMDKIITNACQNDIPVSLNFQVNYAIEINNKFFGERFPFISDSIMIDDTHYFALIKTPDKKIQLFLFDKGTDPPVELLSPVAAPVAGGPKYAFNFTNLNNQLILSHLPQLLYLKENPGSLRLPELYLRDDANGSFTIINSDNATDGAASAIVISGALADQIKVPGSEVKITIGAVKLNLRQIKKAAHPASEAVTAAAVTAPSLAAKPASTKGPLLAERQIVCNPTTPFHIFAYVYKPSPTDSVIIAVRTSGNKTKEIIAPLDWSNPEFTAYIRTDQFNGTCNDPKTDNELSVFFAEYKTRVPYLTDPAILKTSAAAAAVSADTAKKVTAPAAAVADTGEKSNIVVIASQTEFAALLHLRGKTIPLGIGCGNGQQQQAPISFAPPAATMMEIDSVSVTIQNNTLFVSVVGKIDGKPAQTVTNDQWGIGLKEFSDGTNTISFDGGDGIRYKLHYCQLFFVRPTATDGVNYNVADMHYTFFPDSARNKQKLLQKRLLDFISLTAFLDLQSLGSSSTNKNLLTELYFNWPVVHQNTGHRTKFKYFYLNASFGFNLFSNESSKLHAYYSPDSVFKSTAIPNTNPVQFKKDTLLSPAYYLKNFDLIRNSFLSVKPVMNLVSFDIKKANALIEFNAGMSLLGSNIKYNDRLRGVDSISTQNLYSYGYMLETRIRLTPKPNFGVDFHLAWNKGAKLLTHDFRSITGDLNTETLVKSGMINDNKKSYMQGELNFYFNPRDPKSSTDRGGFFVKLNILKSIHYDDGQFMFLVGYSSDIKNFFK